MARTVLALTLGAVALLAPASAASVTLPPSAPGCIAAITSSVIGSALSGQTVSYTDGTVINPATHFLSREWSFGDGSSATSTHAADVTATHTYVNHTSSTERFTVRLVERTGLGSCATSVTVDVSPIAL